MTAETVLAELFASFNVASAAAAVAMAMATTLNSPVTFERSHLEVEERELDDVTVLGPRSDKVHRADERQIPLERFRDAYRVLAPDLAEKRPVAI